MDGTSLPGVFASALPSGVRRGLCPAVDCSKDNGLRPRYGLCPNVLGRRPNEGHSPTLVKPFRRGIAFASHPAA
jgi:hypothetical protein